jgi:3-isopropylmalate/(R)-2-methylmalate dehydratase small subunit
VDPFQKFRGAVAPLDRSNVDTDQIIPKQFLKSVKRTGFGESLFFDWRYLADGNPDPEFVLNRDVFRNAEILVSGNNFGCGSSREHAVWAVMQFGFKCVIAPARGEGHDRVPGFADIFRNNSVKNGLLTIELSEAEVSSILKAVEATPGSEATVDLASQTVTLHGDKDLLFSFEIDEASKETLSMGLDEIAMTLQAQPEISAFEQSHETYLP